MSQTEKLIGIITNAALGLTFIMVALVALKKGQVAAGFICVAVCGLAAYNIYIFNLTGRFSAEEEWLKAEVRKAELRQQLAGLGAFASPDATTADPPVGPPGVSG